VTGRRSGADPRPRRVSRGPRQTFARNDSTTFTNFTLRFLPEGPPEAWAAFDALQARTTTKRNAGRFLAAFNAIEHLAEHGIRPTPAELGKLLQQVSLSDVLRPGQAQSVEESARQLDVPTLVLHTRGDRLIPVSEGVRIAQLVPGSRFMSLPAPNHLLTADEPAWPPSELVVLERLEDGQDPELLTSGCCRASGLRLAPGGPIADSG